MQAGPLPVMMLHPTHSVSIISAFQESIKVRGGRAVSIRGASRSISGDVEAFSQPSVFSISETINSFEKLIMEEAEGCLCLECRQAHQR